MKRKIGNKSPSIETNTYPVGSGICWQKCGGGEEEEGPWVHNAYIHAGGDAWPTDESKAQVNQSCRAVLPHS